MDEINATPETQRQADEFARREGMRAEDLSLIDKFKSAALNFKQRLDNLSRRKADVSKYPALQADYAALMKRGQFIKSTIESVTRTVDKVTSFFSGLGEIKGLSVVPLLPIAVIAGAVAAITKWGTDAYTFSVKLDEIKRLEATGMSPERAASLVARNAPASLIGGFTTNLLPIVAVGVVLFFLWRGGKLK